MSGIDILHWFQSLRTPSLDQLMLLITDLHSETFYIVLLPLLFWLVDKRAARHLAAAFALGLFANELLKQLFDTQRPFHSHPELNPPKHAVETAPGGAFPSGHAMNPLTFWGLVAWTWRRKWLTAAVAVVVFLIGISRLYLGVHWPLDILGGWAFGAIGLWFFIRTARFWRGEGQGFGLQLIVAILFPLVALLLAILFVSPDAMHNVLPMAGAYMGMGVGFALEERYVDFDPRAGSVLTQVLKVALGFGLIMAIRVGVKAALGDSDPVTLIRYFLMGLSATYLLPLIWNRFVTRGAK